MAGDNSDFREFVDSVAGADPAREPRPFDRMMFDVCGEVNHIRSASEGGAGGIDDAVRAFERACARVYADPEVSDQRRYSLRVAEWMVKAWCVWGVPGITRQCATRWFDAWQRERNMSLLQL